MTDDPTVPPCSLRFHLDEHLSPVIAEVLSERGIDTTSSQNAGLLTTDDLVQFQYAQQHGRVFVTQDCDFTRLVAQSFDHFGVVYFPGPLRPIGEIIAALEVVAGCLRDDEMRGRVQFL